MGSWLHQFHVWLDASTWHWAMVEIGGAVLFILIICGIVAACRGGSSSGYSHSQAAAAQRQRADSTMGAIGRDYDQAGENMRRPAENWRDNY